MAIARSSTAGFLAPAVLAFGTLVLYPIAANLWLSLHDWDGVGPMTWVGLDNYRALFADPAFHVALANNLRWMLVYLVAPALGLGLALLLAPSERGMRLVHSLFFMPFVISQVVVGLVFGWFFHARLGLFNALLEALHLPPLALLDTEGTAIYALALAGLWPQTAYCMVLYLTGLAALRPELIDAARMDGARGWRLVRYAVLPQLRPVHAVVAMVCVVSALRSFDLVMIMTAGGPHGSSSVLALYMVEQTFQAARFGYGAAVANVLLALMSGIIVTLLWRMVSAERR